MTQTCRSKVEAVFNRRLKSLYDDLDAEGDLRERGYPVSSRTIHYTKDRIRYLERLKDEIMKELN